MMVMPKKSERERLADLEARQRKVAEEVEIARRAVRGRYASIIGELAVEELTEREFRELVDLAIWCGGAAAEIGRASCRERVCQYGSVSLVDVSLKKKRLRGQRKHNKAQP